MDQYYPADNRASVTVNNLLLPFIQNVEAARTTAELRRCYSNSRLPPTIATDIELRVALNRSQPLEIQKENAIQTARLMIGYHVCRALELPNQLQPDDSRIYYYIRENIMDWLQRFPPDLFFGNPGIEVVAIQINTINYNRQSEMTLTEDQMMGIVYAIGGLNPDAPAITIISSLTNEPVDVRSLIEHTLIYRLPTTLATEELKRPYRVEIRQSDGSYIRLRFVHPEFMQGVLSVAHWYRLSNNGRGSLWRSLEQFTREGIIPLGI